MGVIVLEPEEALGGIDEQFGGAREARIEHRRDLLKCARPGIGLGRYYRSVQLSLAGKLSLSVQDAADLLLNYPALTLSKFDCGPSSGLDIVGPAEIGRLIVIETLSQRVAHLLLTTASQAPWHLVPLDARLEDADPEEQLYWDAAALFKFFTDLPGVGFTIASKMLHIKRPSFFPIL